MLFIVGKGWTLFCSLIHFCGLGINGLFLITLWQQSNKSKTGGEYLFIVYQYIFFIDPSLLFLVLMFTSLWLMWMNTFLNGHKRSTAPVWRRVSWWTISWLSQQPIETAPPALEKSVPIPSPVLTNPSEWAAAVWSAPPSHCPAPCPGRTWCRWCRWTAAAGSPAQCWSPSWCHLTAPPHGQVSVRVQTNHYNRILLSTQDGWGYYIQLFLPLEKLLQFNRKDFLHHLEHTSLENLSIKSILSQFYQFRV